MGKCHGSVQKFASHEILCSLLIIVQEHVRFHLESLALTQLTDITNAVRDNSVFIQSCRQTRMFTFSGERDDHFFVDNVSLTELKSRSQGTHITSYHNTLLAMAPLIRIITGAPRVVQMHLPGGPKKRGHSTFSEISRKLLKISK